MPMKSPTDERLAELTDKLENGIKELYASGRYAEYLRAMSKFHRYSFTELSAVVEAAQRELNERMSSAQQEQQEFEKLQSWADLYDNCTFAAKKMIVSQFIKAVYVYRDYTIEVEFNVSFDEFKDLSANCTNEGNEKATVYPVCKEKDRSAF